MSKILKIVFGYFHFKIKCIGLVIKNFMCNTIKWSLKYIPPILWKNLIKIIKDGLLIKCGLNVSNRI